MAVITEEPILCKLDRLDNMLRQLEEIRESNRSPKSLSEASTPSSGILISEGQVSSIDLSPKIIEKHCLPINRVMVETEVKESLVERLDLVEKCLLKLEGELESERKREEKIERKEKKVSKEWLKRWLKETRTKEQMNQVFLFLFFLMFFGLLFCFLVTKYSKNKNQRTNE